MMPLEAGARGIWVTYLQLALQRAVAPNLAIDGIFLTETQNALTRFQQQTQVNVNGIVTQNTWNRLIPYLRGYTTRLIRSGDTLQGLAQQFGTDVQRILQANPGLTPTNLQVGSLLYIPFAFSLVSDAVAYSSFLNDLVIDGLCVRYPFLRRSMIGKSAIGQAILSLRFGEGEREVFYNASHHANEWITTPVLLRFMEELCEAYVRGEALQEVSPGELFSSFSLYMVPMVNPDGVDLVTGALNRGPAYEQALAIADEFPGISFPNGWKANIRGVDLNLQYPAGWEQAREIKFAQGYDRPAPRDYVGTEPLSAPESLSVYEFTRRHDFLLTLSYHSQGRIIYWKYLDYEPQNSRRIANYFGQVSGYTVEETPYASGFAGYKDWFIQQYNRPGYTIEVGRGQSPLPLSQFPGIYRENLGILLGGMTQLLEIETL